MPVINKIYSISCDFVDKKRVYIYCKQYLLH